MLKGISPLISPALLKCLSEMGHGDTIVIGDCNYPAASTCRRILRADGVKATDLVSAIMKLLPLDVDEPSAPVVLMGSTDHPDMRPEIWKEFEKIILDEEPKATFESVDRFGFYEKAKNAFVSVQTSEEKYFGCIILRKGVWFTKS